MTTLRSGDFAQVRLLPSGAIELRVEVAGLPPYLTITLTADEAAELAAGLEQLARVRRAESSLAGRKP